MYEIQNALHSLPSGEHLTARRATRLKFVQREVEQLRQYIEDLESSLALNKKLLQELLISKADETEDTQSRVSPRNVEQLLTDIRNLETDIKKIKSEKEAAEGIALINEQIAAECHRKEQELIQEFEDKLQELQYQNEKKERVIGELEARNKQLAGDADLYKKSQHLMIAPPHEQLLDLITLTERRRQVMQRLARDLHWARTHREILHENCKYLWEELQKTQALLKNPVNRKKGADKVFLPRKDMSFDEIIDRHDSVESSSDDSLPEPPFPEKFKPQTQGGANPVPALDFTKLKRAVSMEADVLNESYMQQSDLQYRQAHQLLGEYRKNIESLTGELLEVSRANSKLQAENCGLADRLQSSQQSVKLLSDTLKQLQRADIERRSKQTVEIKATQQQGVAFRLRRHSSSSDEEIVIRSESLYGEEK